MRWTVTPITYTATANCREVLNKERSDSDANPERRQGKERIEVEVDAGNRFGAVSGLEWRLEYWNTRGQSQAGVSLWIITSRSHCRQYHYKGTKNKRETAAVPWQVRIDD